MNNIDFSADLLAFLNCSPFRSPATAEPVELYHEYHLLLVITAGRLWFRAGGEDTSSSAGDVVLHRSHLPYTEWTSPESPAASIKLLFNTPLDLCSLPPVIADTHGLMRQLAERIASTWWKYAYHRTAVPKGLLAGLLAEYQDLAGNTAPELVVQVRGYTERHLTTPFSLADLAEHFGLNPFYFVRKFKRLAGHGPMEEVRNVRLNRARELAMNTDLPVKVIAAQVGFRDPSYFSRAFRAHASLSVRQLRVNR